uniref:RRM domain-containing protein n=1 Tax=Beta vulgaris subsp. vulgaris TaxID=3555 RepID=F4NCK6_BETVV|nr:hypothetical protein [Beta vulgaris subsp. vulgaris]
MREERASRERNKEFQWTTVKHSKTRQAQTQARRTCFINHLPATITIPEISQIFRTHGAIANILIPASQKNPDQVFAFVKFHFPQSMNTALRDEHGKSVKGSKITVFPAKYDKPTPKIYQNHKPQTTHTHIPNNPITNRQYNPKPSFRDARTYREVANPSTQVKERTHPNSNPNPNQKKKTPHQSQTPPDEKEKHQKKQFSDVRQEVTLLKSTPSRHRIMSSRCLGESTEQTRNSLKEIEENGEFAAAIEGERCKENDELFQRSAIGITDSLQEAESIMDHIMAEGVNCIKIKAMGGMQHLLIFETLEDKQNMIDSKWLERWFIAIRNVNKHSAALWRETWINIYGTPLIAWEYRNFLKIGSIFGRVKSILYGEYDCAHILIITDCLFDINCKIQLQIDEVNYPVFVSEKQQIIYPKSRPSNAETESESEESSAKQKEAVPGKSPSTEISNHDDEETKSHNVNDVSKKEENTQRHNHETQEQPLRRTEIEGELKNLGNQKQSPPDINTHPIEANHDPTDKAAQKVDLVIGSPAKKQSQSPIKTQDNHNESPTKLFTTNSPTHSTKKNMQTHPEHHISPIQLQNKFGPLLRSRKTISSSISSMGSSTCSGPLFPPGFEQAIPIQTRIEKERKRRRKMEIRSKLKSEKAGTQKAESSPPHRNNVSIIHIDDVIKMAETIGLTFKGPVAELRKRIESILAEQRQNWEANA